MRIHTPADGQVSQGVRPLHVTGGATQTQHFAYDELNVGGSSGLQYNIGTYGPHNVGDWLYVETDGRGGPATVGMEFIAKGSGGDTQVDMRLKGGSTPTSSKFNLDVYGAANDGLNLATHDGGAGVDIESHVPAGTGVPVGGIFLGVDGGPSAGISMAISGDGDAVNHNQGFDLDVSGEYNQGITLASHNTGGHAGSGGASMGADGDGNSGVEVFGQGVNNGGVLLSTKDTGNGGVMIQPGLNPTEEFVGFFGVGPVVKQATPVTLGDVIALLQAYGLSA